MTLAAAEPTVEQIVHRAILSCAPDTPVFEAARRMQTARHSSIIVIANGRPVGIWTEADALKVDLTAHGALETPVSAVMSQPVLTIDQGQKLTEVGRRMRDDGVRHYLAVDNAGQPVGVVSQTDVVLSHGVEHFLYMRDVESVLARPLLLLPGDMPLNVAAREMRDTRVDSAVVTDAAGRPDGIITERDLVRLIAERRIDRPLSELASRPLIMADHHTSLLTARGLLERHGIRHLGVIDDDGRLIGVLSFAEILQSVEYEYIFRLQEALNERDRALRISEKNLRLAQRVIDSTLDGIIITDAQGFIQSVNPAFTRLTGYEANEVIGKTPSMLSSGRHDAAFYRDMWDALKRDGFWQGEIWNRRRSGEIFPEWLTITAVEDEEGRTRQFAGIFSDITERKKSEERIKNLAYFDVLTGLPNRRLFNDRLSVALANAHRHHVRLALMFIDLDLFKRINDTLGHSIGDAVLQEVATRLEMCLREGDTVSRMGGDEFTVLMPEIKDAEDAAKLARRVIEVVRKPFMVGENELYITASIGISIFPEDGDNLEQLVKNADTAMYRAKELGRNGYQLYAPVMNARSFERLAMETDLRQALASEEFLLNYQLKMDMESGRGAGVEALIRWRNRDLGIVQPTDFIPLAEDLGLIGSIGEWVLLRACQQARAWVERGLTATRVAVNISAQQFRRDGFVAMVKGILEATRLDPHLLELEITESALMERVDEVAAMLTELRAMGIFTAIDDFGTGYSSFNYLKRMPIDALKIDTSFVRDISINSDDAEIVSAIIAMAHNLRLRVVAEGVETEAQMAFLRARNCDEIQGFLIARPVSADNVESLLDRHLLGGEPPPKVG